MTTHTVAHRLGTVDPGVDTRARFVVRAAATAEALHRQARAYAQAHAALVALAADPPPLTPAQAQTGGALQEARLTTLAHEVLLETRAREHAFAVDALALLQRVQMEPPR